MRLFEKAIHLIGWTPTGSSFICDPPVLDTDEDFVLYTATPKVFREELEALGYVYSNKDIEKYKAGKTDPFALYNSFDAYRHPNNKDNLIVVKSADDFLKWKVATLLAKELNLTNKDHRIMLFRVVRSGGKCFELPEPVPVEVPF